MIDEPLAIQANGWRFQITPPDLHIYCKKFFQQDVASMRMRCNLTGKHIFAEDLRHTGFWKSYFEHVFRGHEPVVLADIFRRQGMGHLMQELYEPPPMRDEYYHDALRQRKAAYGKPLGSGNDLGGISALAQQQHLDAQRLMNQQMSRRIEEIEEKQARDRTIELMKEMATSGIMDNAVTEAKIVNKQLTIEALKQMQQELDSMSAPQKAQKIVTGGRGGGKTKALKEAVEKESEPKDFTKLHGSDENLVEKLQAETDEWLADVKHLTKLKTDEKKGTLAEAIKKEDSISMNALCGTFPPTLTTVNPLGCGFLSSS